MKPNTYTIQYKEKNGNWIDWRFCASAKIASWKTKEGADRYASRLKKSNPETDFRVIYWMDYFTVPTK